MQQATFVSIVTTQNFAQEVLAKSHQVPVLADFWAAWCAPCQMLMPILTKLANEYAGKFILAKINSDEQQQLAIQYAVRSLPTLKVFRDGVVVDEIMGAQPEPVLRELLERHIERPGDAFRAQAEALSAAGQHTAAIELMQRLKQEDATYPHWDEIFVNILLHAGEYAQAESLLKALPANVQAQAPVQQALARLSFAHVLQNAPEVKTLEAALAADAKDLTARYQLSAYQVLQGNYAEALENLLFIMRSSRPFQDDAGRKGLVAVFDLLGNDPLVSRYRSKMSSLLY